MQIGFIGLGKMGFAMASRLLETRHRVIAWNRSPHPAEELVRKGAGRAATATDAFDSDVAITMLRRTRPFGIWSRSKPCSRRKRVACT
jgi:3-hydroxyisobutyrate dehydrogenase-like beta-hydroxyacid dehydrogenase